MEIDHKKKIIFTVLNLVLEGYDVKHLIHGYLWSIKL